MPSDEYSIGVLQVGLRVASPEDMEAIGAGLAACLPENCVLTLSGTLGVGKTTLVRGIARGLGIQETVSSPTFNIYNVFQGTRQLIHMDAYRLANSDELDGLMLDDIMTEPWLWVVEWPENVKDGLPETRLNLRLWIEKGAHFLQLLGDGNRTA